MISFEALRAAIRRGIKRHSQTLAPTVSRPYAFGDDARRIDWSVTARTGELHVRRNVRERSITFATIAGRAGIKSESVKEVCKLWHLLAHANDRCVHIADDDVTGALRSAIATARSDTAFLVVSETHAIPTKQRIHWSLFAAFLAGMLLLVTSCSHPRFSTTSALSKLTVAVCIDTSGSMASSDIAPTRARAVITAVRAFLSHLPTRASVEIIAFSSDAGIIQPRTTDRLQLTGALQRIPFPNGATAIGDAFALARRTLPGGAKVVLITDGVNNRGVDPLAQARMLASRNITISAIGIGSARGDTMPGTSERASIDPNALRAYAEIGHGSYHSALSADALSASLSHLAGEIAFAPKETDLSYTFAFSGACLLAMFGMGVLVWGR